MDIVLLAVFVTSTMLELVVKSPSAEFTPNFNVELVGTVNAIQERVVRRITETFHITLRST